MKRIAVLTSGGDAPGMNDRVRNSKRPYLIRAMHGWMMDNGETPHVIVDAEKPGVEVPRAYVKDGKVSFEFRNFVRDPYDITAALIARCNGASAFFPLTRAMYADQRQWLGKLQQVPPQQAEAMQAMPPAQQFATIAGWAGLQQFAAMRGVPTAKSGQCLANQSEIDRLVQMNSDATEGYDVPGTPAFLINNKLVEGASSWERLEPEIKKALG